MFVFVRISQLTNEPELETTLRIGEEGDPIFIFVFFFFCLNYLFLLFLVFCSLLNLPALCSPTYIPFHSIWHERDLVECGTVLVSDYLSTMQIL